jgi:hypothetical protein
LRFSITEIVYLSIKIRQNSLEPRAYAIKRPTFADTMIDGDVKIWAQKLKDVRTTQWETALPAAWGHPE